MRKSPKWRIFKANQGKTKGNVKDASVLKTDHNKMA